MKDFPAAFQRQTESYEFSLRFCSLQDAEQAARDLIDFLMTGAPRKQKEANAPEHPQEPEERPKALPRGPIAYDLNRYMQEHGYSERVMANLVGTTQNSVNNWRRGIYLPKGKNRKSLFALLYGTGERDGTK